ncbi:MAG: hypothetical protein BGP14_14345 [Sphingobacteriales bacterium 44-15]|nr:MAG: hypothetical protein BGP14_14345 [Sphingobacteriales bacterium 44-15]
MIINKKALSLNINLPQQIIFITYLPFYGNIDPDIFLVSILVIYFSHVVVGLKQKASSERIDAFLLVAYPV